MPSLQLIGDWSTRMVPNQLAVSRVTPRVAYFPGVPYCAGRRIQRGRGLGSRGRRLRIPEARERRTPGERRERKKRLRFLPSVLRLFRIFFGKIGEQNRLFAVRNLVGLYRYQPAGRRKCYYSMLFRLLFPAS